MSHSFQHLYSFYLYLHDPKFEKNYSQKID